MGLVEEGIIASRLSLWHLMDDEEFRSRYARAEADGAAAAVDEAGRIVDEAAPEMSRVADLRARHRYWVASRRDPRRWGDKIDVTSAGEKLPGVSDAAFLAAAAARVPAGRGNGQ
jgi:hypothetical protein